MYIHNTFVWEMNLYTPNRFNICLLCAWMFCFITQTLMQLCMSYVQFIQRNANVQKILMMDWVTIFDITPCHCPE